MLIDELELIGSYSVLQRARSYAELARWMGDSGEDYPGLVVVAAITEDFAEAILEEKGDRIKVPDRMRTRGEEQIARLAETGMRWIEGHQTPLHEVTPEAVEAAVETIRRVYSAAYDWEAPPATTSAGAGYQRRMRYKVRSAITTWDLQRLHPESRPELESDEYRTSYTEDPDLEVEAKDDEPTS